MFVRGIDGSSTSDLGIRRVVFKLHPTFNPPTVTVSQPPFEVGRIGWGIFDVGIEIYTDAEGAQPVALQWTLQFEESIGSTTIDLDAEMKATRAVVKAKDDQVSDSRDQV